MCQSGCREALQYKDGVKLSSRLAVETRFENNSIFVLDFLSSTDLQTARRLAEDLSDLAMGVGAPYCRYVKVSGAEHLFGVLDAIRADCENGLRPIIHFEAHGDRDGGLEIADAGEFVIWADLVGWLLRINTASKNNLGVVMAACFGLYAISPISLRNPTPFFFLVGSDHTVSAGYIDERMRLFYQALFRDQSLDRAMQEVQSRFKQFHAEKFFCSAFAGYIRRKCMGRGASQRIEAMVSQAIVDGIPRSRHNLRMLRVSARKFVKSESWQRSAFNRLSRHFLHGKVSLRYEDVERFVRQSLL